MRAHYLPVVDMRTRFTLLSVPLLLAVVLVGCGKNPVRPEYVTPWSRTSGPGGGSVTCFASDGSTLLAGVADGGVFRSTDAGETWSPVRWAVDDPLVTGLAFSNGKVFAGTWVGGVLRSNNNGDSWIPVNHGLPDQFIYSLGAGNGTVFVDTQFGLYRSTDDGRLWLPVNSTLHARSFLVSGSEVIAAGYQEVQRSTDNGSHWTVVGDLAGRQVIGLGRNGSSLFAATSQTGVLRSDDGGQHWIEVNNGLPDGWIEAFACGPTQMVVGVRDAGIYRSIDGGDHWMLMGPGPGPAAQSRELSELAIHGPAILAGVGVGGVYRSMDGGSSWVQNGNGPAAAQVTGLASMGSGLFAASPVAYFAASTAATIGPFSTQLPDGLSNPCWPMAEPFSPEPMAAWCFVRPIWERPGRGAS